VVAVNVFSLVNIGLIFLSNCFEWLSLAWKFASISSGSVRFLSMSISECSVASHLRYDGMFNYYFAINLLLSVSIKIRKSVSSRQS